MNGNASTLSATRSPASTKADLAILQQGLDFDPVVQGREHREI
jgi:hypothetical protein